MASKPNNVPSGIAIPGGAPMDALSQAAYLTNLANQLNAWLAQAANAINFLLSKST